MLRPKKNSYTEFNNEKKIPAARKFSNPPPSPFTPPPHNFSNSPSLNCLYSKLSSVNDAPAMRDSYIYKERLTFVSLFRVKCSFQSGAPKTVFCKISVRGSKYRLELPIAWERLNIYRRAFHSGTIFEALLPKKFPTIFLSLIFHILLPLRGLIFLQNGNLKFLDSKMW